MRYFITFACYGVHLHGEPGSVDRDHNLWGNRFANESFDRVETRREQMDQLPYSLDKQRRQVVLGAIREGCLHRGWILWAAHVRTSHVHAVVEAEVRPEIVMNAHKSYSSRDLNGLGIDDPDRKRWARHGSTCWLFKDDEVQETIRYVIDEQGEPMEVYLAETV